MLTKRIEVKITEGLYEGRTFTFTQRNDRTWVRLSGEENVLRIRRAPKKVVFTDGESHVCGPDEHWIAEELEPRKQGMGMVDGLDPSTSGHHWDNVGVVALGETDSAAFANAYDICW